MTVQDWLCVHDRHWQRSSMTNVRELYHGTSLEAALRIQDEGFRIELSGTNAGAMLGDGVYCTTALEKALNYAKDKPHGGVILKMDVGLGRCKTLGHGDPMMTTWHRHGYDSAWSGDGVNGLREENCVRDPSRCKIKELILGNTSKAKRAGYEVRGGRLFREQREQQERQIRERGNVRQIVQNGMNADAWFNLGVVGGGSVQGRYYSKKECYQKALDIEPEFANAWYNLGNLGVDGGGWVQGRRYSQKECYEKFRKNGMRECVFKRSEKGNSVRESREKSRSVNGVRESAITGWSNDWFW